LVAPSRAASNEPPREPIGILRESLGQDLDRHLALQVRIARAIHLAHPAGAKGGQDFIRAETNAGLQGQ